jgi:uncharacterized repeat protein (TIGR01451 family)
VSRNSFGPRSSLLWPLAWLGIVALATIVLGSLPVSAGQASTRTVTNTADSGVGSLRQAIADAQPGDTVVFSLTLPATITLTSGQLEITQSLTIDGPGSHLLAISGNDASRVFQVDEFAKVCHLAVSLSGLTIQNGDVGNDSGGGLWNDEILTLTDVAFRHNSARYGGGMYNKACDSSLTHVSFSLNSASYYGGGLYANGPGSPRLTHVSFSLNWAGQCGGGLHNASSSPRGNHLTFTRNSAYWEGGAIYNNSSNARLTNATFRANYTVTGDGGAIYNNSGNLSLTNATLSGNAASQDGGAMYTHSGDATLTNLTFTGNWASGDGGGLRDDGGNPTIYNSIFWANTALAQGDQIHGGAGTIAHSNIQGSGGSGPAWDSSLGSDGGGNLDQDPLFLVPVDPEDAPTTDGDLHLQAGSPAINGGDNILIPAGVTTDLDGLPRVINHVVDMGAYEYPALTLWPGKDVDEDQPEAGDGIVFTITLSASSSGGVTVTQVLISDTLPAGLTFAGPVSLEPPQPGALLAGDAGDLPALARNVTITDGHRLTVTFPVTVDLGVAWGTVLTNTAGVTSSEVIWPLADSASLTVVDLTSPQILAVSPISDAQDVHITAPLVITFSEPISVATLAYDVLPDPGGWAGTWHGQGTVVTLTHAPFASSTLYTATVSAAGDLAGNPLDSTPFAWRFTTADMTAPQILAVSPVHDATDVDIDAPVVITFSEPISIATLAYDVLPDPGGWAETWHGQGTVVTLTHAPFARGTVYTVTVSDADDLAGNSLESAPVWWRFSTTPYTVYLPLLWRQP